MKTKIFFTFMLLVLMVSLASASESLTYDKDKLHISYEYDFNNRLVLKTSGHTNVTYFYDGELNNTLTNVTDGDITIKYEYDDRKRVIRETKIIDDISFVKETDYDSMDRATNLNFYSNLSAPISFDYIYGDDSLISNIENYLEVNYTEFKAPHTRIYGNELITRFGYNYTNFRLKTIKTLGKQFLTYDYDLVGNILSIIDSMNHVDYLMDYDALNRLVGTNLTSPFQNETYEYTYSSIGNIKRIEFSSGEAFIYGYSEGPVHAPSVIYHIK